VRRIEKLLIGNGDRPVARDRRLITKSRRRSHEEYEAHEESFVHDFFVVFVDFRFFVKSRLM